MTSELDSAAGRRGFLTMLLAAANAYLGLFAGLTVWVLLRLEALA